MRVSSKADLHEIVQFEIFDRDQSSEWLPQDIRKFSSIGHLIQHAESWVDRGYEIRLIWEWKR